MTKTPKQRRILIVVFLVFLLFLIFNFYQPSKKDGEKEEYNNKSNIAWSAEDLERQKKQLDNLNKKSGIEWTKEDLKRQRKELDKMRRESISGQN